MAAPSRKFWIRRRDGAGWRQWNADKEDLPARKGVKRLGCMVSTFGRITKSFVEVCVGQDHRQLWPTAVLSVDLGKVKLSDVPLAPHTCLSISRVALSRRACYRMHYLKNDS